MGEEAFINDRYECVLTKHGPIGVDCLRLLAFMLDRRAYVVREPLVHGKLYVMDSSTRERLETEGFHSIRELLADLTHHALVRELPPEEHGLPEINSVTPIHPKVHDISARGLRILDDTRDAVAASLARRAARPKLLVISGRSKLPTGEPNGIGCFCEVIHITARSFIVRVIDRVGDPKDSERLLVRNRGRPTVPKGHVVRYGATRGEWERAKAIEERRLHVLAALDAYYGLKIATLQQEWDRLVEDENGKASELMREVFPADADSVPMPSGLSP